MPWVKIDDQFPEHPKVASVGPLGMAMQVAGLCYCNRKLTDGFIPRSIARTLLDWETVDADGRLWKIAATSGMRGEDMDSMFVIDLLVDAGIWDEVPGGYQIHDYHDYQPSKEEIEREREAARERMTRVRANRKGSSGDVRANNTGSSSYPVPDPVPVPKSSSSSRSAATNDPHADAEDERISEVWGEIARRKREGTSGVRNVKAWTATVIAQDRAELLDEARRYVATYPTITVSQLAGVLMGEKNILRMLPRAIGEAS